MSKIGRNHPCPCGSGKKYKKCCINKAGAPVPKRDDLDLLMEKGWLLQQNNKSAAACDVWLDLWGSLKTRFHPNFKDIQDAESVFSGCEFLSNWCQDLETELENAGRTDLTYHQKRIAYCSEFCSLFPKSSELIIQNMMRAIAESHFALGKVDDGDNFFESLINEYPSNIWGYIGWGDMYVWPMRKDMEPDYERAEHIFGLALNKGMEDEDVLLERIDNLKKITAIP